MATPTIKTIKSSDASDPSGEDVILLKSHQKNIEVRGGVLLEDGKERDLSGTEDLLVEGSSIPKNSLEEGLRISRDFYKKVLSSPFENIIVLSGAGTSVSSGGKAMKNLWEMVFPEEKSKENEEFFNKINFPVPSEEHEKNLEELLSQATKAEKVLQGVVSKEISERIEEITKVIIRECTLELNEKSPHLELLNKLTSRKFKYPRVKVFTLNYDLLFEKAASVGKFIVINGFSFSSPAYFNGAFFDYDIVDRKNSRINPEENFVPKVFHLYKPHGSINWGRGKGNRVVIEEGCEKPIMIYPNADKYEYGYDQPFFEMMSHFQQSVRKPNSLLICVGFGFGDKHFRNVIIEAVKSNPGLILLIALPNFSENDAVEELRELSEKQNNIFFIKERFEDFVENYPFSTEYESEK